MIDTHSHMLPGLDHGCPDLDACLLMAQQAWDTGVETVVCTPHFYEWDPVLVEEAREVRTQVQQALSDRGVGLELRLGFEVDANVIAEADDEMLSALVIEGTTSSEETNGRKGGIILIETPFHGWPPFLQESLFRLRTRGYLPVLAHPERNERIQRSPDLLTDCARAGAVIQGTAGSLCEPFRRDSMRTLLDLLARGDVNLLASDGHAHVPYTWGLAPLLEELSKRVSVDYLNTLVDVNPRRVLSGIRPVPTAGDRTAQRSWWKR